MSEKGDFERFFYTDDCPIGEPLQRGMFYRTMKLGTFVKDCEEKGFHIVGLRVDESNNGEFLFVKRD
jgi:hypothetical protein